MPCRTRAILLFTIASLAAGGFGLPHSRLTTDDVSRTSTHHARENVFTLPIHRREPGTGGSRRAKRAAIGAVGLGDDTDLLYTVQITLGNTTTTVDLDTGSSDLWVISSSCNTTTCLSSTQHTYQQSSFQPINVNSASGSLDLTPTPASVKLQYGDSTTGTHAIGPIGREVVQVAGLKMDGQAFVAVNDTDSSAVIDGGAGIFGVGFPAGSQVQMAALLAEANATQPTIDDFIESTTTNGPLLARMAATDVLAEPMFSISLQRSTIAPSSGQQGQLTLGGLPTGVSSDSMTWVPVKLYTSKEGGLDSGGRVGGEWYPLRWEIPLDAVFFDGRQLPRSSNSNSTQVTALIDTGNSIIRGPADIVSLIYSSVSSSSSASSPPSTPPTYPCSTPHTLEFQIGGKRFPVDPRDFVSAGPSLVSTNGQSAGDGKTCSPSNVVATDAPSVGATFSWNLGDTFLKSATVAFYYGNLTHPSSDPPRIGFLSTVPPNANDQYKAIVNQAANGGGFVATSIAAPPATISPSLGLSAIRPIASVSGSVTSSASASVATTATSNAPSTVIGASNANSSDSSDRKSSGATPVHVGSDGWMSSIIVVVLSFGFILTI
ncbi:acid protease [Rickenella mellea]|uniref:Acid protease n=1 Tax=Rickenella mellea TaxID=50990 RepID=A0A4Y7PN70_9AGAM|nr:acid protease [Rickenella mellea]